MTLRLHLPLTVVLLSSLLAAGPGCAGARGPQGPSSAPTSNVFLRNAFDTDPSSYMGRFVPRGATDLDESSAMPLTCSQYISHRFVDAGGVKVTELMSVSTEIAGRIGVPVVAEAKGGYSRNREVRVEYTLTGKMIAEVTDPAAFEECCAQKPDQCTDRFIGEFLQGTGTVYREDSRSLDLSGEGTNPSTGTSGSGGLNHDRRWEQAIEFPNPVYFAFKITQTPSNRTTSSCGRWVDSPPSEPDHVFFVGMSREFKSERQARERALLMAQFKAYASAAHEPEPDPENPDASADMHDPAAQRWAFSMQIVESCVEVVEGRRGARYVGRVLGKLPNYVPALNGPAGPSTSAPPGEPPRPMGEPEASDPEH